MGRVSECCHRRVSFLPLKENIPNFKMKLFFVLALVVMSFGGLNAAVIPEEMEFSAAKGDILTDDQIARVILEVIAKSESYEICQHYHGLVPVNLGEGGCHLGPHQRQHAAHCQGRRKNGSEGNPEAVGHRRGRDAWTLNQRSLFVSWLCYRRHCVL